MTTYKTISFAMFATWAACALADDAVGLVRVDAGTNGLVEAEMPFAPMDESGPLAYVSGAFIGDGGALSDQLFRHDASTGETTNAVWSASAWLDPFTGLPSFMQAFPGDALSLLRTDDEPFSFFLFGRAGGIATRTGAPRFHSMSVDPAGEFADLSVFTRGLATDLFTSDFATNHGGASSWFHVGRYPGHSILFDWRDAALPTSGGRIYLAADATRDSDGDGLPDEMERRVYGTSPYLPDTDGDGLSDSLELAWGSDPLVADQAAAASFFSEPFEPPAVVAGPIGGQNGWTAGERPASAVAQGEVVYEGIGALELNGGMAAHSVTCSAQVVWVDQRVHFECGSADVTPPQDVTAFFYFDVAGHPVMSDGGLPLTNLSYSVVGWRRWTRCTTKLDYSSRRWDMYVDGVIVGEGLSMCGDEAALSFIEMGGAGAADNILVTTERPLGLSSDGDELPDEWEVEHFGDLSHDGSADSDGDGMSDMVEFRAGTDPLAHNGDTDGDGLPDWWEAANGLNPLGSNDFARAAFRETFEEPYVSPGDVAGQNRWTSSRPGAGEVQGRVVHAGAAALSIRGGSADDGDAATLSHSAASHADVVWFDLWQVASRGSGADALSANAFAVATFDREGRPVLSDGDGLLTNLSVRVEEENRWVRCTCRFDFPNRAWDFYLDGVLVSSGLAMRGSTGAIHAFDITGGAGCVDDIYVGVARPEGLSSDGDALPDEWEWRNIGSLGRDGLGDLDCDGLSDFDEYAAGTNPASADTDGDGLPDAWEIMNGLDPLDASDAALDSDGDGLSNLAEFNAGTDPHLADTDGDGLPDAWELSSGTDPFTPDALADPDGDGLVNIEEYVAGSTPTVADTDGDGLTDYVERTQLGTDPSVVDAISVGDEVHTTSSGRHFMFDVVEPQSFAVTAAIAHYWKDYARRKRPVAASNRIVFRIDGHFIAFMDVSFDCSNVVHAVFYTPVLPIGEHLVSIEWCSPDFRARAEVVGLVVNRLSGLDFEEVVRRRNSSPVGSFASRVSPAFVEGEAMFPWLVSVGGLPARASGGASWFADVPLSAATDTVVDVCFEGLVSTNLVVAWEPTDVFAGAEDVLLRRGSSILLAGVPSGRHGGAVSVFTNGVFACSYAAEASAPIVFDSAGEWRVCGVWTSEDGVESVSSGNLRVTCMGGAFPSTPPACFVGQSRQWPCPGLSSRLVYDTDAFTHLSMSANGSATLLVDDTRGERIVAARISDGGPVLDSTRIDPMWAVDSFGNVAYLAKAEEDHDRCRCYMRQYGASSSVRFRIRSYTSSVLLDDYSTERWIGPEAFDLDGVAWYELVKTKKMSAPCHTVVVFQDGVRIGEAVYGNGTLPEELR